MASATSSEVGAGRCYAIRRWFQNTIRAGAGEPRLSLHDICVHAFSLENEGNENSFAAAVLIRWKTRQAVPAINQFFDFEFQELILCHSESRQVPIVWLRVQVS